jgi:aspartate/methionine/tyrosine aminotransferase
MTLVQRSSYLEWIRTIPRRHFNLAASGVVPVAISDLSVKVADLELTGLGSYGYEPLLRAIANKCGVSADDVVAATGTSMANHLAMAVLIQPGDEVLIESPTYEPLLAVARYLGARIRRFERSSETGFALDPRGVEREIGRRTRLIVLTNLHNPSGALASDGDLAAIGEIARSVGARILVDEVYLDAAFELKPRSARHLGDEFVTTSSLTKVYGLGGLRCGWILAPPELARRMWRLNDLFGVDAAHIAEQLSCLAFRQLGPIYDRARALLTNNRPIAYDLLACCSTLEVPKTQFGTTLFPRLKRGSADELCRVLQQRYDTLIVPGRFFEMPTYFRIGMGGETETLVAGLQRVALALNEIG